MPIVSYDVDGGDGSRLADEYGVTGIPALIFIGKDGSVAGKLVGVAEKEVIVNNIKNIIE